MLTVQLTRLFYNKFTLVDISEDDRKEMLTLLGKKDVELSTKEAPPAAGTQRLFTAPQAVDSGASSTRPSVLHMQYHRSGTGQ